MVTLFCMDSSNQPEEAGRCQVQYANSEIKVETARPSLLRLAQEVFE